jgi:CRP-like cAMP-binding protein
MDDQSKISEFFKAGEYLFKNGTPSYGAFFVCSGKIELIYQSDDGFFIKEIKNAGDIIGEDNLDIHYYVFDAVALEDCEVYFYDKNFFLEELKEEEGGAL